MDYSSTGAVQLQTALELARCIINERTCRQKELCLVLPVTERFVAESKSPISSVDIMADYISETVVASMHKIVGSSTNQTSAILFLVLPLLVVSMPHIYMQRIANELAVNCAVRRLQCLLASSS